MKLRFYAFLTGLLILFSAGGAFAANPLFNSLQKQLVRDGFDTSTVAGYYDDPRADFASGMVVAFFKHDEAKLDYDQFLAPDQIELARNYLSQHKIYFDSAEAEYGVPRQVIVAILLVESRFGQYLGKSKAFNVLSTMAALQDDSVRQKFYVMAENDRRLPEQQFMSRAEKRSAWAYKELKALIKYANKYDIDVFYFRSSYAGALGFCQFMPSNIEPYGADGDGDGKIDLFTDADAIHSVAKYLNQHGLTNLNITRESQEKAVYRYNHSSYYVDAIMSVADALKY